MGLQHIPDQQHITAEEKISHDGDRVISFRTGRRCQRRAVRQLQQREVEKRLLITEIRKRILGTAIATKLRHPLVEQTRLTNQVQ